MGKKTSFDKKDNVDLVDKFIGTAYDKIVNVADNLELLQSYSNIVDSAPDIDAINTNLTEILAAADNAATATTQAALAVTARTAAESAEAQTGLDAIATAADRAQTALDRIATGNDATATAADAVQTALDRVQTGLDVTAAGTAASAASDYSIAADLAKQAAEASNSVAIGARDEAVTARIGAEAALTEFEKRYLGSFASAPTTDNDGGALLEGSLYWKNTENTMYVRSAGIWEIWGQDRLLDNPATLKRLDHLARIRTSSWRARIPDDLNPCPLGTVTWSAELGIFLAFEYGANSFRISTDGISWDNHVVPVFNIWNSVIWAPEVGLFVAVATSSIDSPNKVITSPDGITWTIRTTPAGTSFWYDVVWSSSLNLFVAVGSGGAERVITSPDGITWTARTAAEENSWQSVTWSHELGIFVAVAGNGANRVMTSSDGITWTIQSAAEANVWRNITWSPELDLFVAVASSGVNRVMTSPDGITWTAQEATIDRYWRSVSWSPELGIFVAVSDDGGVAGSDQIMTSVDGINWDTQDAPEDTGWWTITWSPEKGIFLAGSKGYNGAFSTVMHSLMPRVDDGPLRAKDVLAGDISTQVRYDYDRSPLFVDGTDFTAGFGNHVITVPSGWDPTDPAMRFYLSEANGQVSELTPFATTATTFTLSNYLDTADVVFIGDDKLRNQFDGDPSDIRTRINVKTDSENDTRYLQKSSNLSDISNVTTARTNLDVYSKAEIDTKDGTKLDKAADKSTQAESEAGTDNTKYMTPLRTAEAITALAGGGGTEYYSVTRNASGAFTIPTQCQDPNVFIANVRFTETNTDADVGLYVNLNVGTNKFIDHTISSNGATVGFKNTPTTLWRCWLGISAGTISEVVITFGVPSSVTAL